VLAATNRHSGLKFAVKMFQLQRISRRYRDMLVNELEVLLSVDHPHVVRLVDVYQSDETLSLVMERLEGGELAEHMSSSSRWSKRCAEDSAAQIARQMLLSVSFIHSQGIVHRDIKPDNFLFSREDSNFLVLIDFGFSRFFHQGESMLEVCGTPGFVAPEVMAGDGYTAGSCDLWSVGVIVSAMLNGCMPFSGSGKPTRWGKLTKLWGGISAHAQDFVQQLLTEIPEMRLTAEQALAHPWIKSHSLSSSMPPSVVDDHISEALALCQQVSKFHQACVREVARALPKDERSKAHDIFMSLDQSQSETVKLHVVRRLLEACRGSDGQGDVLECLTEFRDDAVGDSFRGFDQHFKSVISDDNLGTAVGASLDQPRLDSCITQKELTSYMRNWWMLIGSEGSTRCSMSDPSHFSATSTWTTVSDRRGSGQGGRRPPTTMLMTSSDGLKPAQTCDWWSSCIAGIFKPVGLLRTRCSK